MASIILGLLLLGLIRPQTVRGNSAGLRTYKDAGSYCNSSSRLPLYMDSEGQTAVTKEMEKEGYTSVWLPVKRKYIGWQLLNGTNADKKFAEDPWPRKDTCAILHLPNRVRQAAGCNIKRGYICQSNGSCSIADKYCFQHNSVTFHYQCEKMNWYAAREKCEKDGKVLALITNLHSTDMFNEMRKKWPQGLMEECDKVWIGLRKEEWVYDEGTKKAGDFAPAQYWDAGEPNVTGECVILQKKPGGTYVWKATDCSKVQHVACQVGVVDVQMTVKPTDEEETKVGFPLWQKIIVVILVVLVILILVAVGIWRWRKKKSKSKNDDESEHGVELQPLKRDEPDYPVNGTAPPHDTAAADRRERLRQRREEGEDYCGLEEEEDGGEEVKKMLDDDLSKFAWYHGPLKRSEAQELIKNPGDYLVYRADAEEVFVLVIGKANNSVVHHPIEVVKGQEEDMLKCNGITFAEISDIEKDENFKKSLELVSPVLKEAP